jgi:hypothetical protein
MYIIRIKKEHPSNAKLVPVQNEIMRNKGGSTPDDWGTSKEHRVASEKHYQGFKITVLLTNQGGLRKRAASNFIGDKKVKNEEYRNGIGAAPHFARNCEQGTDQHNSRPEKHELRQNSVGQTHTNAGKGLDIRQKRNAPHHQKWRIKVKLDRNKADNGAVHTFARENTPGLTDDKPSTSEVSGYTQMPLHQPQRSKQHLRIINHSWPVLWIGTLQS